MTVKVRARWHCLAVAVVMVTGALTISATSEPAVADGTALTEDSLANIDADLVNRLGDVSFAREFAGASPVSGDQIMVYVLPGADDFIAAAQQQLDPGVQMFVTTVHTSYSDMDQTTKAIAGMADKLAAAGVELSHWGPDVSTNQVRVTLATTPSATESPSTTTSDVTFAQQTFDSTFGPGAVVVESTPEAVSQTMGRDTDSAPYTGGNGLYLPGPSELCTDSWPGKNSSGQIRVLSAGHCGTGDVMVNGGSTKLGKVLAQKVGGNFDYETISADEQAKIWRGDTSRFDILGFTDPAVGSYMVFNGDTTGSQQTGLYVAAEDQCTTVDDPKYGIYIVCGMGRVTRSTAFVHPGDSGGPAYVRNSAFTGVWAAGTIESASNGGTTGWFASAAYEMANQGLTLVTTN